MQRAGAGLEKIVEQALRQVPAEAAPMAAWPLVCGSAVAERTRAISFTAGVLRVEVSHGNWKAQLQELAPRYLAEINRYTHDPISRIEFIVPLKAVDKNFR